MYDVSARHRGNKEDAEKRIEELKKSNPNKK